MNPNLEHLRHITRRHFLGQSAHGLGAIALGAMLKNTLSAAVTTTETLILPGRAERRNFHFYTAHPAKETTGPS